MGDLASRQAPQHHSQRSSRHDASAAVPGKATLVSSAGPQIAGPGGSPYKGSIFKVGAIPWPDQAVDGHQILERFVGSTEAKLRTLSPQRLRSALGPDAVIATITTELAEDFEQLEVKLARAKLEAPEATALLDRLDAAMDRLFTLARDYRVRMRESGLERAFDGEDKLRLDFSYHGGRANRAELYYDDNLAATERRRGSKDAHDVADMMQGASTSLTPAVTPQTRDDLIRHIQSLGTALAEWIELGFEEAKQAIDEPSAPRDPDLLERLGQLAATLILSAAEKALGVNLEAIAKAIDKKVGAAFAVGKYATKQVGAQMARSLLTGFIGGVGHSGKALSGGLIAHANKPARAAGVPREIENDKLSAKAVYLKAARRSTVEKAVGIQMEFSKYVSELKRLPVETLATVADCIGDAQREHIMTAFSRLIVREWVNFGKHAMERGEEVRDDAHRPAHPSKLDNFLAPYGVVRIVMTLHSRATITFESADLPGVSDAVLGSITKEETTLGKLSVHRHIALRAGGADRPQLGAFELDPQGTIVVGRMSAEGRLAFARLANPLFEPNGVASTFSIEPSEGDVIAGARIVATRLAAVSCNTIKAVKVDGR